MRFFTLLLTLFFVACSSSDSHKNATLRFNLVDDPPTLDPRLARDLNASILSWTLFEGLTRSDGSGHVQLALADHFERSHDGLRYLFHIRESYWSNGERVTSHDIADSWRSILDPNFPTPLAYHFYVIRGAKLAKNGEIPISQVGIQTPDEQTILVELEAPTPYFLELISLSAFCPVYRKLDQKNPSWGQGNGPFISNGPFTLSEWRHQDCIRLMKNPYYWGAKEIALESIQMVMVDPETELQMFESGDLDWAGSPLSSLPLASLAHFNKEGELHVNPSCGTFFLRVNTNMTPLNHPLIRKAIGWAIQRQDLVDHILQGGQIPALSLVPPIMGLELSGYFPDANGSEARLLLEEGLSELGIKREELKPIKISFVPRSSAPIVMQAIQQQLETQLGIKVELEPVERKAFYERISTGAYELASSSWIADFNDPSNFLNVFKFRGESTNNTGWENSRYVALLTQADHCLDKKERFRLLSQAENILMEEMPIIPLYHYSMTHLEGKGVRGIVLSPMGHLDFRYVEKRGETR